MNKVIPVLTSNSNYARTATWLMEKYSSELDQYQKSLNELILKNGTRLIMVSNIEQLLGLEFTEYLISPQYWDLRREAESRSNMCKARGIDGTKKGDPNENVYSDNIIKGGFIP